MGDSIGNNNSSDSNGASASDKCISVVIKYKDRLFKNKTNTIKVSSTMSLQQFVSHLCDSININPNMIQLQHHSNIIDTSNALNMQLSLAQLEITNFDNIFV